MNVDSSSWMHGYEVHLKLSDDAATRVECESDFKAMKTLKQVASHPAPLHRRV